MPAFLPVYERQTDAAVLVHLHGASASTKTNGTTCTRQDHHREFQALALVDRHDTDHVFIFSDGLGFAHGQVVLLHGVDIRKESVKSRVVALFKSRRFFHQHPQV